MKFERFAENCMSLIIHRLFNSGRSGAGEKGELKIKVEPTMLLKTHVEKMSTFGLSKMFMKTQIVTRRFPRC